MPTSKLLQAAATIAARFEAKGQPIDHDEAIERARAAHVQLAQLEVLRRVDDWADTAIEPPLPAGVSIAA